MKNLNNWRAMRKLYRSYGIKRRWYVLFLTGELLYLTMVIIAILLIVLGHFVSQVWCCNEKDAIQVMLAIGAGLLGVQQWRAAKTEASFDKFYERLTMTNKKLDEWPTPRVFIAASWEKQSVYQKEMYACLEVDNLEYMIQKYERGFMEPTDAFREVTCFSSRCESPEFSTLALAAVRRGGYKPETVTAIKKICKKCNRRNSGLTAPASPDGSSGEGFGAGI